MAKLLIVITLGMRREVNKIINMADSARDSKGMNSNSFDTMVSRKVNNEGKDVSWFSIMIEASLL